MFSSTIGTSASAIPAASPTAAGRGAAQAFWEPLTRRQVTAAESTGTGEPGNPLREAHVPVAIPTFTAAEKEALLSLELDYATIENAMMRLSEEMTYDGFDAVAWKAFFLAHLTKTCRLPADKVIEFIGNCIVLIAMRGAKIKDMNTKVKEKARAILEEMKKLGVNLNPEKSAPASNVITLSRIAAVFPKELSVALGTGRARIVGEMPHGMMPALAHPNSLALIPAALVGSPLWDSVIVWRRNFAGVIRSRSDDTRFIENIHRSALYNEGQRWKIMGMLLEQAAKKVLKTPEILSSVVQLYGGVFWEGIKGNVDRTGQTLKPEDAKLLTSVSETDKSFAMWFVSRK
jgi:hypothetical protein